VDGKLVAYPRAESRDLDIAGTVPSDARLMDKADHLLAAFEADQAAGRKATRPDVALRPGGYRANLAYGDANSDGTVNSSDASAVLFAAVGLAEIIATADTSFDIVVAGNVAPQTATPIGTEPDGSRIINSTDASLILNDVVLGNVPQIGNGTIIPGRAVSDTSSVAQTGDTLTGFITADRTLLSGRTYVLNGLVRVKSGATLTIEAGTRVLGRTGAAVSALFIERDGRINAQGSQLNPIVFSCTGAKVPGCWGGVFIAGNAPTNQQNRQNVPTDSVLSPEIAGRTNAGCLVNRGEGDAPLFGGCNPDDNSGTLRYAVIEYGGQLFAPDNELNNLTLSGVGRGTTIEYIQVRHGLDDGFELFGGTVDARYIVATGNSDDQFDYAQGWIGRLQFLISHMFPQDGDKGFEIDNHEVTAQQPNQQPWGTYGDVWNVTMIGDRPTDPAGPVVGNSVNDAFHIRRGAKTQLANVLVFTYNVGLDIDDAATCATDTRDANSLTTNIRNSWFGNIVTLGNTDSGDPAGCDEGPFLNTGRDNTVASVNPFRTATVGGVTQSAALFLDVPDYRPTAATSIGTPAAPASRFNAITPVAVAGYTFTPTGGSAQTVPPATGGIQPFTATPVSSPGPLWTRPEYLDNTANYVGAVPFGLTSTSIPWYAGWTRSGVR
jgi:hypothetical protein